MPILSTFPAGDIAGGALPVEKGGTGTNGFPSGAVLIGAGTNAITTREIDTTSGGTSESSKLITSGAVHSGLSGKADSAHTHDAADVASGTLDIARIPTITIAKGGTGNTNAKAGLRALIAGCNALTDSEVAPEDLFPFYDASDILGAKKITLANLVKYFAANIPYIAKIQSGIYVGDGTYGASNPNNIWFDFVPKLVFCGATQASLGNYSTGSSGNTYRGVILTSQLTTEYQAGYGFGYYTGSTITLYAKKSAIGKTISWYSTSSAVCQNNKSSTTYYWLAIG